ncbi:MAG: hypothetical protein ACOX9E_15000 [Lentisphaeria bacterium]|jgi:hypothetical protein
MEKTTPARPAAGLCRHIADLYAAQTKLNPRHCAKLANNWLKIQLFFA